MSDCEKIIQEFADRYSPTITFAEAAEIAGVPRGTVYGWSAVGRFDRFKFRVGRGARLHRDEFVKLMLKGGLTSGVAPAELDTLLADEEASK